MALLLVAAAALIDEKQRVLVQQRLAGRSMAGLWEFPGGKVEPGETVRAGLARELAEELGVVVDPLDLAPAGFASEPLGGGDLLLLLFACRRWTGEPAALDAAALRWVTPAALRDLPMPPADLPLIAVVEALV